VHRDEIYERIKSEREASDVLTAATG
jgi:hypothetical protein